MTTNTINDKFKAIYYPTTQNIFDAIDYDIDIDNSDVVIVNLGFFAPLPFIEEDVHIFNMGILEIIFLHLHGMVDGEYLVDLIDDIDSNVLEAFIGKDVFRKYRPLLNANNLMKSTKALLNLTTSNKVDTIMLGWLKGGNRYDAGIATV